MKIGVRLKTMISYRQADLLEKTMKTRLHDVFFYIWFASAPRGFGEMEDLVRDHQGRLSARLEVYFPDKLTKWDDGKNVEESIRQKIEKAINQPLNQRIYSKPHEDISHFSERLKEHFEPKLKQIDKNLEFDSLVSHGMCWRLKMTAL